MVNINWHPTTNYHIVEKKKEKRHILMFKTVKKTYRTKLNLKLILNEKEIWNKILIKCNWNWIHLQNIKI